MSRADCRRTNSPGADATWFPPALLARNSPLQGQAFFYFGGDGDRFAREFADIGVIYPRAKPPPAQS